MDDTLRLLCLSVVQGLAEFLPISSSGHLVLAGRALGVESPGPGLELFLHAGTLCSICLFYRKRIAELVRSVVRLEREGLRYALFVAVSMVPAFVFYCFAKDAMDAAFDSVRAVGWLLVVNGALLLLSAVTDKLRPVGGGPTALRALAMGVGQALAVLPGISRSGTSIHAGRLAGMSPSAAAEFSFIMSIPVIAGAVVLQFKDGVSGALAGFSPTDAAIAAVVSAVVGYVALKIVVKTLSRGRFWMFGVWCLAVGTVALLAV